METYRLRTTIRAESYEDALRMVIGEIDYIEKITEPTNKVGFNHGDK